MMKITTINHVRIYIIKYDCNFEATSSSQESDQVLTLQSFSPLQKLLRKKMYPTSKVTKDIWGKRKTQVAVRSHWLTVKNNTN